MWPLPVFERLRAAFRVNQEERAKSITALPKVLAKLFQEKVLLEPPPPAGSNLQEDYRRSLGVLGDPGRVGAADRVRQCRQPHDGPARRGLREMALRISIGAGRWRLVQMVLVESAWIALLAAAPGALFAWWSAPFIVGMINPPDDPARLALPADWRVLAFGLALTSGVTFLFGLAPALRASAVKPVRALKGGEDPHSRRRVMHMLIAVQVAFCFLVLFVAGLCFYV